MALDSFDSDYAARLTAEAADEDEREARARQRQLQLESEQRQAARQGQGSPTSAEASPGTDPGAPDEDRDFLDSLDGLVKGIGGGLRDAGVNIGQTALDLGGLVESGIDLDVLVPDVELDEGDTAGQIARPIVQFASGFFPALGAMKALKGIGAVSKALTTVRNSGTFGRAVTSTVARDVVAGSVTDFSVFDPHEARLSDLLNDLGVNNPVVEYLRADENDSELEGRVKNVLEGAGLGLIADGLIRSFAAAKGLRGAHATALDAGVDSRVATRVKVVHDSIVSERSRLETLRTIQAKMREAVTPSGNPDVAEVRAVREGLERVRASLGDSDPVAAAAIDQRLANLRGEGLAPEARETLIGLKQALASVGEGDAAGRAAIEARIAEVSGDEGLSEGARGLVEGANLRGLDFEDSVRDLDQSALDSHFLNVIKREDPELGLKMEQIGNDISSAMDRELDDGLRALSESMDEFHAMKESGEYGTLPKEVRDLYDRELDKYRPDNIADDLAQAEKNLPEKFDTPEPEAAAPREAVTTTAEGATEVHIPSLAAKLRAAGAPVKRAGLLPDDPEFNRAVDAILMRDQTGQLQPGWEKNLGNVLGLNNRNFLRIESTDDLKLLADDVVNLITSRGGGAAEGQFFVKNLDDTIDEGVAIAQKELREAGRSEAGAEKMIGAYTKLFGDTVDLPQRMAALRVIEESMFADVRQMVNRMVSGDDSTNVYAAFLQRRDQLVRIADLRSGVATNIGRALQQFNGIVSALPITGAGKAQRLDALSDLIAKGGGKAQIKQQAEALASALDNVSGRDRMLQELGRSGLFRKMTVEFWLNAILSGPITQSVNLFSNTVVALWSPVEYAVAGALQGNDGLVRAALSEYHGLVTGIRAALRSTAEGRRASLAALGHQLTGQVSKFDNDIVRLTQAGAGVPDWMRAAATGESILIPNAKQYDIENSINAQNVRYLLNSDVGGFLDDRNFGGHIVNAFGAIVNLPGRALTAGDELAKGINYHMRLNRLAYEDALQKNLPPGQFEAHIKRLTNDVPGYKSDLNLDPSDLEDFERLHALALDGARRNTFTDPLTGKSVGRSLQEFVNRHPTARFIMPFVRTPVNLFKYTFERTPGFHKFTERYKQAVQAASIPGGDTAQLAAVRARYMVGGMLWMSAGMAAYEGKITGGGPEQPDERAALLATGWKPYSFKQDNPDGSVTYTSFSRTDPFGLFLGIAGNLAEAGGMLEQEEFDKVAVLATIAVAENLTSKSYFTGLTSLVDAINRPEQKAGRLLEQFAGSFIPNVVAQTNVRGVFPTESTLLPGESRDDVMREVDGVVQKLMSRLPGFSKELPARRNIFGEVVRYPHGYGPDTISPFYANTSTPSPVDREIARLAERGFGVNMRSVFGDVGGVKLTPEQKDRLIVLASRDNSRNGNDVREGLAKLFRSSRYRQADDSQDGRQRLITEFLQKRRTRAKTLLRREDPALDAAVRAGNVARRQALVAHRQQTALASQSALGNLVQTLTNQ